MQGARQPSSPAHTRNASHYNRLLLLLFLTQSFSDRALAYAVRAKKKDNVAFAGGSGQTFTDFRGDGVRGG